MIYLQKPTHEKTVKTSYKVIDLDSLKKLFQKRLVKRAIGKSTIKPERLPSITDILRILFTNFPEFLPLRGYGWKTNLLSKKSYYKKILFLKLCSFIWLSVILGLKSVITCLHQWEIMKMLTMKFKLQLINLLIKEIRITWFPLWTEIDKNHFLLFKINTSHVIWWLKSSVLVSLVQFV